MPGGHAIYFRAPFLGYAHSPFFPSSSLFTCYSSRENKFSLFLPFHFFHLPYPDMYREKASFPYLHPMRYFATLAYRGTNYFGWQKQPNQPSVQSTIEEAIATITRMPTEVIGCGRTDTGVHAKMYVLHFDTDTPLSEEFINRINKLLPPDIAFYQILEVDAQAHARYDAYYRSYEYHIGAYKDPFATNLAYHYHFLPELDLDAMQEAAQLLMQYQDFFPFCKTNTDVKTMKCELKRSEWEIKNETKTQLVFHIAANRFLRGMVRLIVGMCLNVGLGKTSLEEVKTAMDQQTRLKRSWSVPPQGLYLNDIRYPYLENNRML